MNNVKQVFVLTLALSGLLMSGGVYAESYEVSVNCPMERTKSVTVPFAYANAKVRPSRACACSRDKETLQRRLNEVIQDLLTYPKRTLTPRDIADNALEFMTLYQTSFIAAVPKTPGESHKTTLYCLERSQISAYVEQALAQ